MCVCCLSMFMIAIDTTVANLPLPLIGPPAGEMSVDRVLSERGPNSYG